MLGVIAGDVFVDIKTVTAIRDKPQGSKVTHVPRPKPSDRCWYCPTLPVAFHIELANSIILFHERCTHCLLGEGLRLLQRDN